MNSNLYKYLMNNKLLKILKKIKFFGLYYYLKKFICHPIGVIIIFTAIIIYPIKKIRFNKIKTKWLGQMVLTPELTELEKIFSKKTEYIDIYISDTFVCNKFFFNKLKKKIIILPSLFLSVFEILSYLKKFNSFFNKFIGGREMQAYDFYNLLNRNKIIFDISKEEKIECERILNFKIPKKHIGIILLCSRDSDYNEKVFGNTDWSSLDYRNYDINIFRETIAYLNQKKYVVLRMGMSSKYNIDYENEYFIDYANSNWRSDKMDYFLGFKTVLCVTTNTGMDSLARLFRKPIAQITTPLADLYYFQSNIFNLTGRFRDIRTKKLLSLKETIKENLHLFSTMQKLSSQKLSAKIQYIKFTSDEIKNFIIEVIERLNDEYKIDEKDNLHQKIFWKTYFKNIRHSEDPLFHLRDYNKIDNFSYSYLRNNSEYLD